MDKFEASNIFWKSLQSHPEDFIAKLDSGRDHKFYIIQHKDTGVSIVLEVQDNHLQNTHGSNGEALTYVNPEILNDLLKWSQKYIEDQKVLDKIKKDKAIIEKLIQFYSE